MKVNPAKPWLIEGGVYADYLEIEFRYHPEPLRYMDGSTAPKGWSYSFYGCHRNVWMLGFVRHPTLLAALVGALESYCSSRDSEAWQEWADVIGIANFVAQRVTDESQLLALEPYVGTAPCRRDSLYEATSLPELASMLTLGRWLAVTEHVRHCWAARAKEKVKAAR